MISESQQHQQSSTTTASAASDGRVSLPTTASSSRQRDTRLYAQAPKKKKKAVRTKAAGATAKKGAGTDDSQEWIATLSAFQMYKAAYGNLKVPQRFVVPNMKPWPKSAWGMRLGKVVQNIRATGKYIQGRDPARRQVLDDLGFLWQVRNPKKSAQQADARAVSLEQMFTALSVYSRLNNGSIHVPLTFVVPTTEPWPDSVKEMPLGRQVGSVLPNALEKPENEAWRERFGQLGYEVPSLPPSTPQPASVTRARTPSSSMASDIPDATVSEPVEVMTANDLRFQKVYTALLTYKTKNGDLLVPQPFVVPSGSPEWPESTWGMRLGARVNAIRSQGTFVNKNPERRQLLDDLGFSWNPPRSEIRRGRRKASEEERGPMAAAPAPAVAPTETGARLFPFGDENDDDGTDDELSSLFDASFDMKEFGIPGEDDDGKSKSSWGFEGGGDLQELARQQAQAERKEEDYTPPQTLAESLEKAREKAKDVGIVAHITENNRVIKGKREKNIPWFNDDFGDDFVFDDVLEALTLYKSFYGDFSNLTANYDFVVPAPVVRTGFLDDEDDMMAFDADASARAARAIANFEEEGDLDSSEDLIAAEIKRLQQEVGTEEDMEPEPTKVAALPALESDSAWPEHLAGMQLGSIVSRIRDGSLEVRHLEDRKAKLDAIEFDWGDDKYFIDVPFEKAMCAMYAYYLIRGDMFVYEDFVMPDDEPWPAALAGYEIGKAVKRIRELQNFFEAFHPEKVSLLRMIDFAWFPSAALPIDPNEWGEDDELLKLMAFGHPDYAKMIDVPLGMPDAVIEKGQSFETDDPRYWWRKWHDWDNVKAYWYHMGRRDNAMVLREMDYPRMADEHEAKYGPGLFSQIEWTMGPLREENVLGTKTVEEKREILRTLRYYVGELEGCKDINPRDLEALVEEIEEKISEIMADLGIEISLEDEEYEAEGIGEEMNGKEEGNPEDDEFGLGLIGGDYAERDLKFR